MTHKNHKTVRETIKNAFAGLRKKIPENQVNLEIVCNQNHYEYIKVSLRSDHIK